MNKKTPFVYCTCLRNTVHFTLVVLTQKERPRKETGAYRGEEMKQIYEQLGPFFREHKKRYIVALSGLILETLLVLVPPYLIGLLIDEIYTGTLTSSRLTMLTGVFLAVIVLAYIISYVWGFLLFGGSRLLAKQLRTQLMDHFLTMKAAFYETFTTGDLMARATNDLDAISEMAGYGVMVMLDSTVFLGAIMLIMVGSVSAKLALVSLLPIPILAYMLKVLGDKVNVRYKASQDAFASINDEVLESVEGVRVIRAYRQENAMQASFETKTSDVYEKNIQVAEINSTFQPLITLFLGVSYVFAFGYGALLVSRGELSLGKLVSFQVYLSMIVWPVQSIGELLNLVQQGRASLDRVMAVLAGSDQMDAGGVGTLTGEPTVTYTDVAFQYPSSDTLSLDHISFHVKKGHTIGIVGKTGSGKTTLIRQLLRQYPLGTGTIKFADQDIHTVKEAYLHSRIGYVPQESILFSRSIRDNILFGKPDATDAELMEAIRGASFQKDIDRMPEGIHTLVGEKGVALSGGQKQRISIARALLKDPDVLILDDTLSAVDSETEKNIVEYIQQIRQGKTTLITTHRLSAIHHADWILVMEDGQIKEEGTHAQLVQQADSWYPAQYMRQQLKEEV